MVTLPDLWLPILLSAVAVFIASSLIHMVLRYHNSDYRRLPDEEAARRAVGALGLPPGDYAMPHCGSAKEMSSPEYCARRNEGPVALLTVMKPGSGGMGAALAQWFAFLLVVSVFTAYVARLTLPGGVDYLLVHRVAGTAAFMAYGLGGVPSSIWMNKDWRATAKNLLDALIYGLLTGGIFGWLWP
ncbi:hypothetical protein FJ250_03750 [bacterium]|nr:hypothetical protein [bacterium]